MSTPLSPQQRSAKHEMTVIDKNQQYLAPVALAKLTRTALHLPDDWSVFMLKDASALPRVRLVGIQFSTVSSTVTAWPAVQFSQAQSNTAIGFPVPPDCFPIASQIAFGRERDGEILELLLAGWWCHYDEDKCAYLLPRPDVKMKDNRLHCEDGPAVIWPEKNAQHLYYLEGIEVPKEAIMEPSKLPDLAISHENAEVRRVLINFYGHERLMRERGKFVQADDFGTLWSLPVRVSIRMVEVLNSTPEPDGTFKRYMLRVPPTMKTAKEAVAWTFGMGEKEYAPEVQT